MEKTLIYIVIATFLFITFAPLLWVLSTSFKPNSEAISFPPKFLPDSPTLDNYLFVLTDPNLVTSLFNSLAVSLASTGLSVAVSALGGYAFARFHFKGKNVLISTILGLFMIPVVINIIPLYIMLANVGLLNSLFALVLTFQILIIPLNIFLLKNYFETIPKELEEAAPVVRRDRRGVDAHRARGGRSAQEDRRRVLRFRAHAQARAVAHRSQRDRAVFTVALPRRCKSRRTARQ